jgi:hypothetical protein
VARVSELFKTLGDADLVGAPVHPACPGTSSLGAFCRATSIQIGQADFGRLDISSRICLAERTFI